MTRHQLRKWRELRHWTQSDAAKWYGCTLRQWQRYETGETPIPSPLVRLAKLEEATP